MAKSEPVLLESDQRLAQVSAASRGDRDAASQILKEFLPRIRNLTRYLARNDGDADDMAQEAVIAVLRSLPGYRGEGVFGRWLDRVVARSTIAALRRRRVERAFAVLGTIPEVREDEPQVLPDEYLNRRRAVAVLDGLPLEQRYAVVFHHVLGMSVPEIAEELSVPQETVRSRLRLARQRLRTGGVVVAGQEGEEREGRG